MSRLQSLSTNLSPSIPQNAHASSPNANPALTQQPTPAPQIQQPQLPNQANRKPTIQAPLTSLAPGTLARFRYLLAKNDPQPLVIVARQDPEHRLLKGVNLHYLTFPFIRKMLYAASGTKTFPYYNKLTDAYIANGFRSYSWAGIDQSTIEIFDTQFIVQMINMSRTMDPNTIRSIRSQIDQQVNARVPQQQAMPTGPMPMGPMPAMPIQQPTPFVNPTGNQ